MKDEYLLICGASARAAAFSALRAGLRPWCLDLFADADLQARCPAQAIPRTAYPQGLAAMARQAPPGPWMYTGGLENHPRLIAKITQRRPLWGNGPEVLRRVRDPLLLANTLVTAGLPAPTVCLRPDGLPQDGAWLVKPCAGSGGTGIQPWRGQSLAAGKRVHFQRLVEGLPCAAVYLGDGQQAWFLGVTRQLVGESWLHARPFTYCGSIGPLCLSAETEARFRALGLTLVRSFGLQGLFGVDCVLKREEPWAIEVNPRYTASVEVLEYASGIAMLSWHCRVFPQGKRSSQREIRVAASTNFCVGKAVLFAKRRLVFPREGPWKACLQMLSPIDEPPAFADIPHADVHIATGRPVLTLFVRGSSLEDCLDQLKSQAQELDHWLYGR